MSSRRHMEPVVGMLAAALSTAAGLPPAPARAPVGITRAQTAALAEVPGELLDTTLALDHGRLVYGVEIAAPPTTLADVEVDARTGRVLRVTRRLAAGPVSHEMEAP